MAWRRVRPALVRVAGVASFVWTVAFMSLSHPRQEAHNQNFRKLTGDNEVPAESTNLFNSSLWKRNSATENKNWGTNEKITPGRINNFAQLHFSKSKLKADLQIPPAEAKNTGFFSIPHGRDEADRKEVTKKGTFSKKSFPSNKKTLPASLRKFLASVRKFPTSTAAIITSKSMISTSTHLGPASHGWIHRSSDSNIVYLNASITQVKNYWNIKVSKAETQDAVNVTWSPESLIKKLSERTTTCRRLVRLGGSVGCGVRDCHKYLCLDPDVAPKPYVVANRRVFQSLFFDDSTEYQRSAQLENAESGSYLFNSGDVDARTEKNLSSKLSKDEKRKRNSPKFPVNSTFDPSHLFEHIPASNLQASLSSLLKFRPSRGVDDLCHAFSFGIGRDTSYDFALQQFGCKVFSFDMTVANMTSKIVLPNWNVLNLGISNESVDMDMLMYPSVVQLRAAVRTLPDILHILDRADRSNDILKMDVEYNEWKIVSHLIELEEGRRILSHFKQIQLEVHLEHLLNTTESQRVAAGQRYEAVLDGLHDLGFRLAHTFLNELSQNLTEVRGRTIPVYRESLYLRRPHSHWPQ